MGIGSDTQKLLDTQKEDKKRMREYGSVSNSQEAFIAALQMGARVRTAAFPRCPV
jgi:GTP-binding protein LepA